jgi:osmoprotectant transport system substrate-binding protein/osmoprotectant transport system permease protein
MRSFVRASTLWASAMVCGAVLSRAEAQSNRPIVVASKPFGESYLLAEMFSQLLESRGLGVDRRPGLGATEIAFGALRSGAIDVYPEYTGTGLIAILHDTLPDSTLADPRAVFAHVTRRFAELYQTRWLPALGFQNTYAIAVSRSTAARYHLRTLSDLARESTHLTAGFTADFIGRSDGLVGLARVYGLRPRAVKPLAPAVKYQALASGAVDVIDGYSTDGLLARYDLVTLIDDRHFFPPYEAAALISSRLERQLPAAVATLTLLSGRLDEKTMRELNRRVEVDREDVQRVARDELSALRLIGAQGNATTTTSSHESGFWSYLWERRGSLAALTARHLLLVAIALLAAVIVAVPLGLGLERSRSIAEPVIGALGVLETIPSIALLAFMIPLLGVGVTPAVVALWLYALYPVARGTFTGVRDADPEAVAAAEALGTTARQRLIWVRLPLAAPVIMAGIRTAAVITVGAATLAAFIGAGGLGEPIVAGLALADTRMILSGALPAAALALAVDGVLAVVERLVAPAHRRKRFPARAFSAVGLMLVGILGTSCARSAPGTELPSSETRSWFMGFSVIPPKPDIPLAVRSMEVWTKRADAAIMHLDVPWALLLAGTSPQDALKKDGVDLEHYYRSRHLKLVVTIDVTNGLARESEAPALVAAHRSITEPAVQQLYRDYVRALVATLHPDYLGLAAETNLIRAIAPRPLYNAVVRMTNAAAADVRRLGSRVPPLYVSAQVETAWGRLGKPTGFAGIADDLHDFPFIDLIGLSSYPYLGGFKDPDQLPLDYYARIKGSRPLPVMVVEGGWPSASVRGVFSSSPELQARYIARQSQLLEAAKAIGVFQLSFTDLDLGSFPKPVPTILPLFATLGLVDANLRPKPALDTWDRIFRRTLQR